MRLPPKLRPGQIGDYWVDHKPGRDGPTDALCRVWYDKEKRRLRHESLGTADPIEASLRLATWVAQNQRPRNGRPEDVMIEELLYRYYDDWGQHRPSARMIKTELGVWCTWWKGKSVADITPDSLRKFTAFLAKESRSKATVDKYLSAGRAALNHAVKNEMLLTSPRIRTFETAAEREARPPMGRPLSIDEMACFFDSIRQPHLLMFTVILTNTLARSSAIFELTRDQYDVEPNTVALNPEGRIQTKKRRPTLLVPPNLRFWLDQPMAPTDRYITWNGKPIRSIRNAWNVALKASGLQGNVNRYSFRHGMSRLLRRRGIHLDEISMSLGHKHQGANATTAIYAPDDPEHLHRWAVAVEEIVTEIKTRLKMVNIDNPHDAYLSLAKLGVPHGYLTPDQSIELTQLIKAGCATSDLAKRFNVSLNAIYKRQRKIGTG